MVFVVLLGGTVAGANTGEIIHTDFGTGDEPAPTQLTNLNIVGSGDSASLELETTQIPVGFSDSFESESADTGMPNNWERESGSTVTTEVTTTRASDGSQSFYRQTDSSNDVFDRPALQPYDDPTTDPISTSVYVESGAKDIRLFESWSNVILVGQADNLRYYSSGSWKTISSVPDRGEWVDITIKNIDPSSNTYTVEWSTSSDSGVATGLAMRESMSSGYTESTSRVHPDSEVYIDDFEISSGTVTEYPSSASYVSAEYDVDNAESVEFDVASLSSGSLTISAEYWTGSSWQTATSDTVTSSGVKSLQLPDVGSSRWRTSIDFEKTGSSPTFVLDQESIQFLGPEPPSVDNSSASPTGGELVTETPVELSINVSDADFPTSQGDSVTVEFFDASDDSSLGTDTISANGTASTSFDSPEGGSNSWYAVATDEYGNSVTSETFSFTAPDELRIYSETNPSQLIADDTNLRVRFFVEGQETVIERQTNNGVVDLAGLPVDQRFVVTVRDENNSYTYRRIVIDSLVETQDAYLLNESEPNSQILFQLDDPTGEFPPETTTLYVEKPITKDFDSDGTDETQYEVMAGDTFGASAQFPIVLQDDSRYRLRVQAEDGSSRILGAYSVSGEAVEPLQIQRVNLQGQADTGASLQSTIEGPENDRNLYIRYVDPGDETQKVEYRVIDATDNTVYIENTTRTSNSFADVYNLPSNTTGEMSYKVEYQIERSGNVTGGSVFAGKLPEVADRFGVEQRVLNWVSWAAILATMGLLVIVSPKIAPIGGVGMATMLTTLGTINLPAPVIGVAGAVSVLVVVGGRT